MKNLATLALVCALTSSSFAASILSPASVISNTAGEYAAGDLANAFNRKGLLTPFSNGVSDYDAYIATNPLHTYGYSGFEWFSSPNVTSGTIIVDLGGIYQVSGAALWNDEYSGLTSMGITTSLAADFAVSQTGGVINPPNNPLDLNYGATNHAMSVRNARYIKLDLLGPQAGFEYNGLSIGELAFRVEAVPEPATMAFLGAGVLAILKRRRAR